MFDDLPDTMRAAFWWALSGAVGAAIVAFNDRHMKPVPLLIALFTGAAVAAYGVPVVSHFLKIENQNVMLAFAFFLGVGAKPIIRRVATNPFGLLKSKDRK